MLAVFLHSSMCKIGLSCSCFPQGSSRLHCCKYNFLKYCTLFFGVKLSHPCPEGSGGTSPLILNLSTRQNWVVSFMPQLLFRQERNQVPTEQEAGLAPQRVWTFQRIDKLVPLLGFKHWIIHQPIAVTTLPILAHFFSGYFAYCSTKNGNVWDIWTSSQVWELGTLADVRGIFWHLN